MSITVQVAQQGSLTLPKRLRETHNIQAGDIFTVIDLGDGAFLLRRGESQVDSLLDNLRNDLESGGETLDSMLAHLRTRRDEQIGE
jgi:AbrB family looped-hinge helix DNA binding protein